MSSEIARASVFGMIVFYAAINMGFLDPYVSQINDGFWVDALFKYYSLLNTSSFENNLQPDNKKSSIASNLKTDPELRIPLNIPADSSKTLTKADSLRIDSTGKLADSTRFKKDSITVEQDTAVLNAMARDSTARLKYFRYQRNDEPYVSLTQQPGSEFFAQPSAAFTTRSVKIDSSGKFVEIIDEIAGQQPKILLKLPIEEYIKLKLALNRQKQWEDIANAYELKGSKNELGELIKSFTNFEIPLPSVGVLSIFGKPKISLRIGGAVDIHGAWKSQTIEGITASRLGNTTNEPDFQQQVQINVNGTIGDKLNISADWNTERTFEYENQLKIKYTGYQDEIVQSVEAGNVSLQTSPLVGGGEALFGVKAKFQLGPLTLTTLASQKKGQTKEVNVSNGSTSQTFQIRPYDYSTNNYFVDAIYANTDPDQNWFYKYYGNATPVKSDVLHIVKIEVWKSVSGQTYDKSKERQVNAYMNLPGLSKGGTYPDVYAKDTASSNKGLVETGRFVKLQDGVDYTLHEYTGFITFNANIQDQDAIAVAYEIDNGAPGDANDIFYGDFLTSANADTSKKLVLKLIKPSYLKPQYKEAWKLLLKNIYPIRGRNIKQDGFDFQIKYEIPGQDPVTDLPTDKGTVKLLHAFGLDNYDASLTNATPDGVFDWRPGLTILPATGEIIFPYLQPFGKNIAQEGIPDSLAYQAIYDTTQYYAQQDKIHDRWELTGKYSGTATSVYQLGFNIVENSVRVTLNGRELTAGVDYSVDYNIGQLNILNQDALAPGADLKITYEQNDLFQLASKTLLGARGEMNISDNTKLGFSILNLNQQSLNDKVRIGEEPLSNTIMGVDFNTKQDLPFLTSALDNIVSTKAKSSISLSGEAAYIKPDPNTKKSTIPDDNGQSIAYIDDFEGAKKMIPVGISYTSWKDLSPPVDINQYLKGLTFQEDMAYKAKSLWYTITPSDVKVTDIWPLKQVAQQNQQVQTLDYIFLPDSAGTYNYDPKLKEDPRKNWGGIMKLLSSTANDLQSQNIQYVQFWLHISHAPPDSKLYIDLGRISEDVIPNNILNTEDFIHLNGVIDPGEDLGIDTMDNDAERAYCKRNHFPAATKADPSGDDFSFNTSDPENNEKETIAKYYHINGTEKNAILTDIGKIPDTEDLNLNGNLDRVNSYFRYEVNLDTIKSQNKFITGESGNGKGWYLISIPLRDTALTVNQPSLSDVEYIRMFCTNETGEVHLRIADFNLVGNQWQAALPKDTIMSVSVINIEDNSNYTSPPGVNRARDHSQPQQQVYGNEQSMDLILNGLAPDSTREAVKYLSAPMDLFNYHQLKFFVHGDEVSPTSNVSDSAYGNYNAQVYIRFGTDTSNYYEYLQPVVAGWNDVGVDFSELTAIKSGLDSAQQRGLYTIPVAGLPGHYYGVKGKPSLTSIKYITFGIHNNSINSRNKLGTKLFGHVWINELRVIGADNHPGWAYTMSTSLNFADLMSVNFNMSRTDPYFHRLSDQFGSRVDSRNWSMSANLDLLKLLPFNLQGSNFKLNYSHSESVGKPLYLPGTDIKVEKAAQLAAQPVGDSTGRVSSTQKSANQIITDSQTLNVSDSWSSSGISFKIPSNYWLIKSTINAITLGFNFNKTFSRNPTILSNKTWVWNASASYGFNFSPDDYIEPARIPFIGSIFSLLPDYRNLKVYYAPQNISANVSMRRNRNTSVNRQLGYTPSRLNTSHDFGTSRSLNFLWKFTDGGFLNLSANYNLSVNASLAYLEMAGSTQNQQYRPESMIWHDILSGAYFGRDYQLQQTIDFRTNPMLPTFWNLNQYFQISANYSASYQWNNNFSQKEAGRSAGFSNHASAGLRLALKSLMAPLFEQKNDENMRGENTQPGIQRNNRDFSNERNARGERNPANEGNRNLNRDNEGNLTARDSLALKDTSSISTKKKAPSILHAFYLLRSLAKILLFDYDAININLSSDNSLGRGSLFATGYGNFKFLGPDISSERRAVQIVHAGIEFGRRQESAGAKYNRFV